LCASKRRSWVQVQSPWPGGGGLGPVKLKRFSYWTISRSRKVVTASIRVGYPIANYWTVYRISLAVTHDPLTHFHLCLAAVEQQTTSPKSHQDFPTPFLSFPFLSHLLSFLFSRSFFSSKVQLFLQDPAQINSGRKCIFMHRELSNGIITWQHFSA